MKALYSGVTLLTLILSFNSFSQNPDLERMRKRMEMHEEIHRRIREKLINGRGSDTDLFQGVDEMFESLMNDRAGSGFRPRPEFAIASDTYTSEWKSDEKGKTLILTPKDPKNQLDINVKDQMVTIKSKTETTESSSVFPVPQECDGSKVQMKSVNNSIHLVFPFRAAIKIERRPLQKNSGDIEI